MSAWILVLAVLWVGCGKQEVERVAKEPPPKVGPQRPMGKDAIETKIYEAAGKLSGELTQMDREKVTELYISGSQITDLTPLAGMKGLERLGLGGNKIIDLKPVAGLTELTEIGFSKNQITDLKPLAGLTKLNYLDYTGNPNLTGNEVRMLMKALPNCRFILGPGPTK